MHVRIEERWYILPSLERKRARFLNLMLDCSAMQLDTSPPSPKKGRHTRRKNGQKRAEAEPEHSDGMDWEETPCLLASSHRRSAHKKKPREETFLTVHAPFQSSCDWPPSHFVQLLPPFDMPSNSDIEADLKWQQRVRDDPLAAPAAYQDTAESMMMGRTRIECDICEVVGPEELHSPNLWQENLENGPDNYHLTHRIDVNDILIVHDCLGQHL